MEAPSAVAAAPQSTEADVVIQTAQPNQGLSRFLGEAKSAGPQGLGFGSSPG